MKEVEIFLFAYTTVICIVLAIIIARFERKFDRHERAIDRFVREEDRKDMEAYRTDSPPPAPRKN